MGMYIEIILLEYMYFNESSIMWNCFHFCLKSLAEYRGFFADVGKNTQLFVNPGSLANLSCAMVISMAFLGVCLGANSLA